MMNFLLWTSMFLLSTSLFLFSYSYGGVARSFEGVDVVLLQEAVDALHVQQFGSPYFAVDVLEKLVTDYLKQNLKPYLAEKQWEVAFLFAEYIEVGDDEMEPAYPKKVTVCFEASFFPEGSYENQRNFRIVRGDLYGE